MVHRIAITVYPDCQLLDAAGPLAVFEAAVVATSDRRYDVSLVSTDGGLIRASAGASVDTIPIDRSMRFDTLMVCGGIGVVNAVVDQRLLDFLRYHHSTGQRIGSICTGAFLLAEAGLLDGLTVATHWRFAAELAARYPPIRVDPNRIWARERNIWTSAGVTAGIDLALALVGEDLGDSIARQIAQELVVYHRRPGGQSQFSALLEMAKPSGRFTELIGWAGEHLDLPLSVEYLAERAAMSPRNFSRAFAHETGVTPGKAIERLRLEAARELVERDTHPLSQIASMVGFKSADRMRLAFLRAYGMPPQAIRRVF